ncbi:HEAT repeat domain-containing protein [Candidatus Pacearchaeota archaeon]|nr:HEAT repeat domain-containing protein [Candidatus Pacearchaeota archaeon]
MLSDPSPIVRHECAFSLVETAHPALAGSYLIKAIESDNNIFVIHEALLALGTLGKKEFIPFIQKYLKDSRPEIAESAEIAIQRIKFT